jgi:lantibiotic modifying enzyme
MCRDRVCDSLRSVNITAPAGEGQAGGLLRADWWARALTPDERNAGGEAVRPSWADVVEQAVARAASPVTLPSADDRPAALGACLRPFQAGVRERLADQARSCLAPGLADPGRLAGSYAAALGRQLYDIASRTLLSELDQAAAGGERERFVAGLCTPAGLASLITGYPVLGRLLGVASQFAAAAGAELLTRFGADRAAVVAGLLGGTDPGPAVAIEPGLGDRHREGRAVTAVWFADGRAVIYKPRDLVTHSVFGQVIDWLNERVPGAGLRTPAVLCRPGYGWVEFIASGPLPGSASAAEFFWREGVLLAALYATHTSDMHSENLIACGAVPVLVDVETLFQPSLPVLSMTSADPAAEALAFSVQRAALLPAVIVDEDGARDYSGMSGGIPDRPAGNLPLLNGEAFEPAGYEAALLQGFRLGYDAIAADREAFIKLIEQWADLDVRTVIRPTDGYARLMSESTHPDLLRDARDRQDALDVLRHVSAHHPLWSKAVRHELADLWNGDIPLMTSRSSTRDICPAAGQVLPGVLDQSGQSCVLGKIAAMGEVDRSDQEWIISASLATLRPHSGHHSAELVPGPVTATAADPARLLAAACGLADQVAARAISGRGETRRGRVNWLGLQLVEGAQWMVLPMGAGLADGYLGVALFLAQLAELTGIDRYADLARRAVTALPELLDGLDGRPELISTVGAGGIGGLGGISYGLARMSGLLGDRELAEWALMAAELAATADSPAVAPGWAAGSAGYLAAMAAVQAETGSLEAGRLARACADRLCDFVEDTGGRCGPDGERAPAGFAAGAAGIGWALSRFAGAEAGPRYLAAGRRAASRAMEQAGMAAADVSPGWCSGSAGMLLARLCLPAEASDLESAARSLAERPVLTDLSLCHGELGSAEVLTVLAAATASRTADRARRRRAGLILDVVNRHASYCGTPGGLSSPGLLNGLAGIGYGLLRFGFADRVPSVLLLEPSPVKWPGHTVYEEGTDG